MKEIPNYPRHFADENGEIYFAGIEGLRQLPKRINNGYYRVNLRLKQPRRICPEPVHKLILNAYVGERPAGYVCRHLNGNALDNRLLNLC